MTTRYLASLVAGLVLLVPLPAKATMPPKDGRTLSEAKRRMLQETAPFLTSQRGLAQHAARLRANRRLIDQGLLRPASPEEERRLTVVMGTRSVPVLLGKFSNSPQPPITAGILQLELFDGPWPTGTMHDYYDEISYGNLDLTGTVYDWVTASHTDTYYAGGTNGRDPYHSETDEFVTEVVAANDAAIDFGLYDNDGPDGIPNSVDDDGYVDFVAIVHPELGAECDPETSNNLWSMRSYLSGWQTGAYETNDLAFDGTHIKVNDFTIMPALSCEGYLIQIGVFCHEFGHVFGIRDLYDTFGNDGECYESKSEGIGHWCLMAAGPWNTPEHPAHMCAWAKAQLGWINPGVVTTDLLNWPIASSTLSPTAFKLWTNGTPGDEYFLVENRTADGFDDHLKKAGLLIWHVDDSKADNSGNYVNADECHPLIDLECADQTGPDHVTDHDDLAASPGDASNRGDTGDPFCDGDAFGPATAPSSVAYDSTATTVAVTGIVGCGTPSTLASLIVGQVAGTNDLCMRDCGADVCTEPSPCDVFWESPEVYIDNNSDGIIDSPAPGLDNRLYARVRNIGTSTASDVNVAFYYTDPTMGINFPSDATFIGNESIPQILAGESDRTHVTWLIPDVQDIEHYCVGVIATNDHDGQTDEQAPFDDNVVQINVQALYAKAGDQVPLAPGAGRASGSPPGAVFDTCRTVRLCNRGRATCTMEVRLGRPPLYNDAIIPADWTYTISPTVVTLRSNECTDVRVCVHDPNPVHGEYAVMPLTALCKSTPIGGDVLEFHIDNVPPPPPCAFQVKHEPPAGDDDPAALAVHATWMDSFVDELGFDERVERWRLYVGASADFVPSPAALIQETCLDEFTQTVEYDHRRALPPDPTMKYYKLIAVDRAGNQSEACTALIEEPTAVGDKAALGDRVLLLQNIPNPFSRSTSIHYALLRPAPVQLAVFSTTGRLVRELVNGTEAEGPHDVLWDGTDRDGQRLPAGAYVYRLVVDGHQQSRRMTLLR